MFNTLVNYGICSIKFILILFLGLGSRALGELVASMSDPDLGDRSQDREPPLVKSESSASGPPPAPGLIPLARPDTAASVMSAEKQQVSVRLSVGNS